MATRAVVKIGSKVKEFRIHLCPNSPKSRGLRDFIAKHYIGIKTDNPHLPILVREYENVEPKIWARYEFGKERSTPVSGLQSDEILHAFQALSN